jgi:hypothetical protein
MSDRRIEAEDLRRRFANPPRDAAAVPGCPGAETFWKGARRELSREKLGSVLDHVASCPACTVAWRLTREQLAAADGMIVPLTGDSSRASPAGWRRRAWSIWAPVAAAAVLAGIALLVPWRQPEPPAGPVLRTPAEESIRSLVPESDLLPAEQFTLRWSAGPPGSRYAIRVTDQRLNLIAGARALEGAEYTVPAGDLSGLEAGTVILWQVEAVLPDGRRLVSETFTAKLR